MPAAKSKVPNPDAPLRKLAPSGDWIDQEPTAYAVRAQHAEDALTLALYCYYVLQGRITAKYAGRVARSAAELPELPELPGLRTFHILIGHKRGLGNGRWLATEILEITLVQAGDQVSDPASAPPGDHLVGRSHPV